MRYWWTFYAPEQFGLRWLVRLVERRYCFRCGSQLLWAEDHPHDFSSVTGEPSYSGFLYCPEQGEHYTWRMNIDGQTRYTDDHEARSLRNRPIWSQVQP